VVLGDIHLPHEDPKAVAVALDLVRSIKPDSVILNGDVLDCYEVSKFYQPGVGGHTGGFHGEMEMGRAFLESLRRALPRSKRVTYIEGNHEFRLRNYLANQAPALRGVNGLSIPEQLDLADLGVEYVPTPGERWFSTYVEVRDDFLVGHFNKTSKHAAYVAKGLVDDYGVSLVTGHNHSAGRHERLHHRGLVIGQEGGCLCKLDPPYMKPLNWRQGVTVVHLETGETPHIEFVPIENGRLWYGGRLYRA
jgi:predicted phosphodiesterase